MKPRIRYSWKPIIGQMADVTVFGVWMFVVYWVFITMIIDVSTRG